MVLIVENYDGVTGNVRGHPVQTVQLGRTTYLFDDYDIAYRLLADKKTVKRVPRGSILDELNENAWADEARWIDQWAVSITGGR